MERMLADIDCGNVEPLKMVMRFGTLCKPAAKD